MKFRAYGELLQYCFLSATSTKQPSSKNLTPLHPGKFDLSSSGKVYLQTICYFLSLWPGLNLAPTVVQPLSTFNETSTNADWSLVRQGSFAFMAPCPWTTNCHQLATSDWTKVVTFTVPINSSLKLARFRPSQPLMMSSSTRKWPKTQQFGAILTHFQGNSANDSADQKANSNVSSIVTWPTVMWHYTCITIPNPAIKISRKRGVLTPPPPPPSPF